jgi:hypothetical protein
MALRSAIQAHAHVVFVHTVAAAFNHHHETTTRCEDSSEAASQQFKKQPRPRASVMAWQCSGSTNEELVTNMATAGLITCPAVRKSMAETDRGLYVPPLDPNAKKSSTYQCVIEAWFGQF